LIRHRPTPLLGIRQRLINMAILRDKYRLEDLRGAHGINAGLFIPFVIRRLRADPQQTDAVLSVSLRNIGGKQKRQRTLQVRSAASLADQPMGVPEHTVTEWAALGVACILVALYPGLKIQAVTGQGDRFDYWVSNGRKDYGLEVTGTLAGDLESRHAAKVQQWRENPYGVDGYVVSVGFRAAIAICSFHRFHESRA